MTGLVVAPCSHAAAKYAVLHWHYSCSMPAGKAVKFGAWEAGEFIGAVVFGRGASPDLGTRYLLDTTEVCELVRVALREHACPTTTVVAEAMRGLKRSNTDLRLVVSFADEAEGHRGVIYQAGNWVYTGDVIHSWYRVNGCLVHPKTLHSRHGVGGQSVPWLRIHVDPDAERVPMPPKHRYLYPLDRAMRRRILSLAKPYPSRGPGLDSEPPTVPVGGAGATPAVRSTETV